MLVVCQRERWCWWGEVRRQTASVGNVRSTRLYSDVLLPGRGQHHRVLRCCRSSAVTRERGRREQAEASLPRPCDSEPRGEPRGAARERGGRGGGAQRHQPQGTAQQESALESQRVERQQGGGWVCSTRSKRGVLKLVCGCGAALCVGAMQSAPALCSARSDLCSFSERARA